MIALRCFALQLTLRTVPVEQSKKIAVKSVVIAVIALGILAMDTLAKDILDIIVKPIIVEVATASGILPKEKKPRAKESSRINILVPQFCVDLWITSAVLVVGRIQTHVVPPVARRSVMTVLERRIHVKDILAKIQNITSVKQTIVVDVIEFGRIAMATKFIAR